MKTELEQRTKKFAVETIKYATTLACNDAQRLVARQLIKAGTSIGANYREANRAESPDDFVHKIGIAEKESSETVYWLEICDELSFGEAPKTDYLRGEATELLAIFVAIGRKCKHRQTKR
jgi:four helix bundle protein